MMIKESSGNSIVREIEILREQLHRQKDITNSDTLKLSARLDQLILKVMTKSR